MLMKKIFVSMLTAITILIVVGELVARYVIGLGTPPLSVAHDRIEYLFAPDQDVQRFGNRQLYNEYSMRSPPLDAWGNARRVIVFGDSVLNGGNLTDHSRLGTTLASEADEDAIFANVSAGSWGPGNMLGYIETFGLFDADTVILVLSSHDAGDPPTFQPLDPNTHPTERPLSAIVEGWKRYTPRYMPEALRNFLFPQPSFSPDAASPTPGLNGIEALPILLTRFAETGIEACIVFHATRNELQSSANAFEPIETVLARFEVPIVRMRALVARRGAFDDIFRDDIHINDAGQAVLADALIQCDDRAEIPKL